MKVILHKNATVLYGSCCINYVLTRNNGIIRSQISKFLYKAPHTMKVLLCSKVLMQHNKLFPEKEYVNRKLIVSSSEFLALVLLANHAFFS